MTSALLAAIFFSMGLVVGLIFFMLLKRTVRLFVSGGSAWKAGAFYALRFAAAGGFFFWAAHVGALAMLTAAGGFTLARAIAAIRENSDV